MSLFAPWMVVETRYARDGQVERVIHHKRIGTLLMSETDARRFASQEMGRHAGAYPKRTFRAEPDAGWTPPPPADYIATPDGVAVIPHETPTTSEVVR